MGGARRRRGDADADADAGFGNGEKMMYREESSGRGKKDEADAVVSRRRCLLEERERGIEGGERQIYRTREPLFFRL